MEEPRGNTTERGAERGAATLLVLACLVGLAATAPRSAAAISPDSPYLAAAAMVYPKFAAAMTADGALITNTASATVYWGPGTAFWGTYTGVAGASFSMSYVATATVLVSCPVVRLQKMATPTAQAAGATVTFTICVTNTSIQGSAFNLTITDRIPDNMETVNAAPVASFWGPATSAATHSYSTDNVTYSGTGPVASGQDAPYFLRWTINWLGPQRSACIYYSLGVL